MRFVAHFIADVHQPLHVGRLRDRGGNRIDVIIGRRKSNLHRFWDAQWLLKRDRRIRDLDTARQIASIDALVADRIDVLQSVGVLDWARESHVVRPKVYAFAGAGGQPVRLDGAYVTMALEISRTRLATAGVRLAGSLNEIFCPGPKAR